MKDLSRLTLKDVIDVLADCEINHIDLDFMVLVKKIGRKNNRVFGTYEPACCEEGKNKIYIDSSRRIDSRKKAIIHELVHAYSDLSEYFPSEAEVLRAESIIYNRLYSREKAGKVKHKEFKKRKCLT